MNTPDKNTPDKYIAIYENFMPNELYEECYNYAISTYNSDAMVFKTNKTWDDNIRYDSSPILIHTLSDNDDLCKKIKSYILGRTELRCTMKQLHFYYFTPISHIPWHNDANHDGGITIYLNKTWDKNFGGAFMFNNNGSINARYPIQNGANIVVGGIDHCVCPTTKNSEIRMTIQCFFDFI